MLALFLARERGGQVIHILMGLFILGGLFMIVDIYAPGLRVVIQFACGAIVGIPIAAYIISKMNQVHKDEVVK